MLPWQNTPGTTNGTKTGRGITTRAGAASTCLAATVATPTTQATAENARARARATATEETETGIATEMTETGTEAATGTGAGTEIGTETATLRGPSLRAHPTATRVHKCPKSGRGLVTALHAEPYVKTSHFKTEMCKRWQASPANFCQYGDACQVRLPMQYAQLLVPHACNVWRTWTPGTRRQHLGQPCNYVCGGVYMLPRPRQRLRTRLRMWGLGNRQCMGMHAMAGW